MSDTEICESVIEKMVNNRRSRCSEMFKSSEKMKQMSYMSEYEECLERTQESSTTLRRYLQVIREMKENRMD